MARITKNPVERKQELVDAAESLFLEKGYERTAISDIVKKLNVAQGTFYYYFDSKTDALEAVVQKTIAELEEELRAIVHRSDIDVLGKLNTMINSIFRFYRSKEKLAEYVHHESNTFLHDRLEKITHARLVPQLSEVVSDGVAEGCFTVPYPTETAEVLLEAIVHFLHQPDLASDHNRCERARSTLEHVLVTVLGIRDYSFRLDL